MTTLIELIDAFTSGKATSLSAVEACLEEIGKRDNTGAFVAVHAEAAKKRAAEIDAARAGGKPLGRLAGVPVAIADNIAVCGERMSCDSKILETFRPPYTATIAERLEAEGAILLGRTTLDEFGQTQPGKGAVAAVANKCVPVAVTSDPIQSLHTAGYCGNKIDSQSANVIGFEGTTGRISRFGVMTIFPALSRPGIIAQTTADAALVLDCLAGNDPNDAISLPWEVKTVSQKPKKVGVIAELVQQLSGAKKAKFEAFVKTLQSGSATVTEISMPHLRYAAQVFEVIAACEASSSLVKFDGAHENKRAAEADYAALRQKYADQNWNEIGIVDQMYFFSRCEGLGYDSRLTSTLGALFLNGEHFEKTFLKAAKLRRLIQNDYLDAFKTVDLLVAPMFCNDNVTENATPANHTVASNTVASNLVAAIRLSGIPSVALKSQNAVLQAPQESEAILIL
ncbi:MAG: amidase family protein [Planctomycetaceae bacterium]|nr:amidase family protein [Planctomycetaceae bacterium]